MGNFILPEAEAYRESDPMLMEMLKRIGRAITQIAVQTNTNPNAVPDAPPALDAVGITAANGMVNVAITDGGTQGGLQPGITYFLQYSATPDFAHPYTVPLGPSRNTQLALGNQTLYFRAFSQYPGSAYSPIVYFGSPATAVNIGGSNAPTQQPSAGSGYSGVGDIGGLGGYSGVGTNNDKIDALQPE